MPPRSTRALPGLAQWFDRYRRPASQPAGQHHVCTYVTARAGANHVTARRPHSALGFGRARTGETRDSDQMSPGRGPGRSTAGSCGARVPCMADRVEGLTTVPCMICRCPLVARTHGRTGVRFSFTIVRGVGNCCLAASVNFWSEVTCALAGSTTVQVGC